MWAGRLRLLRAEPLAAAAFSPFGEVVAADRLSSRPVNEGRGLRMDLPSIRPAAGEPSAGPNRPQDVVSVYEIAPSALPVHVALVERHPLSAQLFFALDAARWIAVVMPPRPDGSPDGAAARAFVGTAGQGLVYAPGVWHMPLVALDRTGRFLMRMREDGSAQDCLEHVLSEPLDVAP